MPESTAVPPCPEARRDRMSNRSCARGEAQDVKIFNGGGKSQAAPAALPGTLSPPARQCRAGRRVAGVCQGVKGHSGGGGDELNLSFLVFLTEQVGMCASVKHQQFQFVAYLLLYQQPVGAQGIPALGLVCQVTETASFFTIKRRYCFYCCCHSYIIFRIINYNVYRYCERRTALAQCLLLIALAAFTPQGRCKPNAMELVPIAKAQPVLAAFRLQRYNFFKKINGKICRV